MGWAETGVLAPWTLGELGRPVDPNEEKSVPTGGENEACDRCIALI
jgi:hypothetical protein